MGNGTDLSTNRSSPVVDFTSADFDSIKADLTTYSQATFSDRWTDFNESQFAVVLLDLVAYVGDLFTYQINATLRETFVASALRRQNLANLGKTYDYTIPGATAASVVMTFTLDMAGSYPFTIYRSDTQVGTDAAGDAQVLYHPAVDTVVPAAVATLDIGCLEGEYYEDVLLGVSQGNPGQRWQFPQQGVVLDSVVLRVGVPTWDRVKNFTAESSTATVYKLLSTDDGNMYAVFGDGVFGAVPTNGQEIRASFRIGGGKRGNQTPGSITEKTLGHSNILSVTNAGYASGGANAAGLREARNAIPAQLAAQERCVTAEDYQTATLAVAGVAKVRALSSLPFGQKIVRLIVAPSGGGDPTPALKSAISTALRPKKMINNRPRVFPPVYKSLLANFLIHVNSNYRATEVGPAAREGLVNTDGTGLLDFDQLDFGAVVIDSANTDLLLSQTRLQDHFASLSAIGVDRVEILQLTVSAEIAREKEGGNTGNGTLYDVTLNTTQRRREYYVRLLSASQFAVYERLVGRSSLLTDTVLTDDSKNFGDEGITSYAGYLLAPFRDSPTTTYAIASASGQDVTLLPAASLYSVTQPGEEYFLYNPVPTVVDVGDEFVNGDGSVRFTVSAGATPFVNGDAFYVDVFPNVGDIVLRGDEYPVMAPSDLITRTSGGSRV